MPGASPGRIIAVEGVEGAGKSTLMRGLAGSLDERGVRTLSLREPGGTDLGEQIREVLLHGQIDLSPETELFLFMASRAELVRERILPAVDEGTSVLLDRYLLSSVAYQGGAGGLGIEKVIDIGRLAVSGAEPDLTILLDVEPGVGLERLAGGALDRIEGKGLEYHGEVRRAYLEAAAIYPWPVTIVPAAGTPEEVLEKTWEAVYALFPD